MNYWTSSLQGLFFLYIWLFWHCLVLKKHTIYHGFSLYDGNNLNLFYYTSYGSFILYDYFDIGIDKNMHNAFVTLKQKLAFFNFDICWNCRQQFYWSIYLFIHKRSHMSSLWVISRCIWSKFGFQLGS